MYTITISQKGQVVLPAAIRKKYNLKKGTKLYIEEEEGGILMMPGGTERISAMKGSLKSNGSVTEFLLHERRAEYKGMEKKWKE